MERSSILAAKRLDVDAVRAIKVPRVERLRAVDPDCWETALAEGFEPEATKGFVVHEGGFERRGAGVNGAGLGPVWARAICMRARRVERLA